jgi:2-dehydro-3-deoxyphosphogluconate aldolase/(4S)-4-hydroxy-2-oxoglutarate aldolase
MDIDAVMRLGPVIPVLVVDDPQHARPIAETLVESGLRVLEVTLRTPAALEVMAEMAKVEHAIVGAGTVLNRKQCDQAVAAGAQFIVSPGLTQPLHDAARDAEIPFLPGVATATELMRGLDLGLTHFKFFPAEAAGGLKLLRALCGPFKDALFCPTGGVTQESASQWLELPNVLCVGGSWLVKPGAPDLEALAHAAKSAAGLPLRKIAP